MAASRTRLPAKIVVYCANCDQDLDESVAEHLGVRFRCRSDDPTHLASVVQGVESSRWWLRLESRLLCYQSKWSLSRLLRFEDREGWYVMGRLVVLLGVVVIACYLPSLTTCVLLWRVILGLLMLYLICDIVAVNTSIAFTSRSPANPLRTAALTLLTFFSIAFALSVLFALMPFCFEPPLNSPVRAVYFSFITITTVGYGDIKPLTEAWLPQILIVFEIMLGAYFLVVLLAIVSTWANNRSFYSDIKSLNDVRAHPPLDAEKGG